MSTETQREEFEVAGLLDYDGLEPTRREKEMMFNAWQAAQASQAAELAALKADIAEHVRITAEQATEMEALRKDGERHNRVAELVLRAVEERRDREWDFMHLSLGEAAEIAATIQRERAAMQTKEAS